MQRRARQTKLLSIVSLLLVACLAGCFNAEKQVAQKRSSTSVEDLRARLPNLAACEIESCDFFFATKQVAGGLVPAPSDTKHWLVGSAQLTKDSAAALRADFPWTAVAKQDLPADLASIVPEGEWLMSTECNESFESNPSYLWAFVVLSANAESQELYFLVNDIDHPIE